MLFCLLGTKKVNDRDSRYPKAKGILEQHIPYIGEQSF